MKIEGFFYLCPSCFRLQKVFIERYAEVRDYDVRLKDLKNDYDYDYDDGKVIDSELVLTACPVCGSIWQNWRASDFIVQIKDGKIIPIGEFWEINIDLLRDKKIELHL